jgi:hypothetical protein
MFPGRLYAGAMADDLPPRYRLITGVDDADFCKRISSILDEGYELYGSPAVTFNGTHVIAAQAVIRPTNGTAHSRTP